MTMARAEFNIENTLARDEFIMAIAEFSNGNAKAHGKS
jgi:hypothetical protein